MWRRRRRPLQAAPEGQARRRPSGLRSDDVRPHRSPRPEAAGDDPHESPEVLDQSPVRAEVLALTALGPADTLPPGPRQAPLALRGLRQVAIALAQRRLLNLARRAGPRQLVDKHHVSRPLEG